MEYTNLLSIREENGFHHSEADAVNTERRQTPRRRVCNMINVAFYNKARLYRGSMADLSPNGARIMLPLDTQDGVPDLSGGRNMECYLQNRFGGSKCRGKIQWIRHVGPMLQWGISFIEISEDENDPLLKMIGGARRDRIVAPMTGVAIY